MRDLNSLSFEGLAEEGRADYLSGPFARRPSGRPFNGAAGSGTPRGAGEEGQEEGHGYSKEFPFSDRKSVV